MNQDLSPIAASLRAWLKPRWIYIRNDNPILQEVQRLYTDDEWAQAINAESEGVYIDVWTILGKNIDFETPKPSSLIQQTPRFRGVYSKQLFPNRK